MTEAGHRFCPRCGKALLPDMAFCPGCGVKVGEVGDAREVREVREGGERSEGGGRPSGRGSIRIRIVIAVALVAIGAIGYGLLTRPAASPGGTPGPGNGVPPGATSVPAPIVGLTITSPTDGQSVATKEVTVIGTAPPGLTITQDISFGLDQHTTVDGTGHWAIKVGLNEGENRLTFRIGDDGSTKQTIRVIYTPQNP